MEPSPSRGSRAEDAVRYTPPAGSIKFAKPLGDQKVDKPKSLVKPAASGKNEDVWGALAAQK